VEWFEEVVGIPRSGVNYMSWIQRLFCGGLSNQVESLKTYNEKLRNDVTILSKNYVSCLSDKSQIILNCNKDKQYLSLRVLELSQILAKTITLPMLPLIEPYATVEPDDLEELYDYDMVRADLIYYAFPKDVWETILGLVYPEVKKCLKGFSSNVGDCDDFALVMNAFLVAAIKDAGLRYQGAFTIAWSSNHAYNLYVDDEEQIWIYEPQTGITKGLLADGVEQYKTKKIWFIGERI